MNQEESLFKENYNGILQHDGWVKVAKFRITATVLNVQGQEIQVHNPNKNGSYICNVHKNLLKDLQYIVKGDTVGIKYNCGNPYVVAYRKHNYDKPIIKDTGDCPVFDNGKTDWIAFFKRIDAEWTLNIY